MARAFIISSYLGQPAAENLAEYAGPARKAIEANGGRFIVRGMPVHTYEQGRAERTIVIAFDSVEQAMAAYESADYQAARKLLGPVERDIRVVECAEQ